jgi:protein SCO1
MKRIQRSGVAIVATLAAAVLMFGAVVRPASVAADARWGANYFPDVQLTTQNGDVVHFYDLIKGKIVAIDLIYTNCQYACPLETARLARTQQLLGDRMGRDVWFISISIDPAHDTPEVLKAYAEKYQAGPGWLFLTGKMDDIDLLSKKLGLWSDPALSADGHTPMLLVGNEATAQWMQTSALDNPLYTARIIGDWLNSWTTAKPGKSYAQAAPIKKPSTGEYLFTSLCSNCHTIGAGDRIGPDLAIALGARGRDWLIRYTTEPDVLRHDNDPIAIVLSKKYGEVRMPNLGLTTEEVTSILAYADAEKGKRGAGSAAATAAPTHASRADAAPGTSPLVASAIAIQTSALRNAAVALGPGAAAIERAAGDLEKQTTIAEARRAFGVMSDALVSYLKTGNATPGDSVRIAYCPMVRKSWLQKDGPVANPYYGRAMLECGELTKSE